MRYFATSLYADDYHTTIGVKIDKKQMTVKGVDTNCMIWDIDGEDEFFIRTIPICENQRQEWRGC